MLSVKQGGIKYHFLSLWYDSTWDWTPVSRPIGEYSTTGPISDIGIMVRGWLRNWITHEDGYAIKEKKTKKQIKLTQRFVESVKVQKCNFLKFCFYFLIKLKVKFVPTFSFK